MGVGLSVQVWRELWGWRSGTQWRQGHGKETCVGGRRRNEKKMRKLEQNEGWEG